MYLKFWSWELKFWTLLVLRRSVSHRWFPSPKQISGFHNQNPHENLNRTSFARTSWFLVKVHIKTNSCRITLLSNFGFSNEEINPKNGIYAKNWARQVLLENFDFLVNICAQVNFWKLDICTISEFQMKKWVPKSECTRKIEWDKSVLAILTFWSRSRVHLVKAFSDRTSVV